jgi:ribosomal protein S18 acetylase RimI-like enzyme
LERIRRAEPGDAPAIASLHRREIPWGLLSQLGEDFVEAFYSALVRSRYGFGFVSERDGVIIGYAAGVVDWRRFNREFVRGHLRLALRALATNLRTGRWRRLLETTRYATSEALPRAELVAIALAPAARGTGIGAGLVRHVLDEFAVRQVPAVRVTAGGENVRARRLYERLGFRLHSRREIHRGEPVPVYTIGLTPSGPRSGGREDHRQPAR